MAYRRTILLLIVAFSGAALASDAGGEFTILHSPKYMHFLHSDDAIDDSEISSVIAAYLGLPLNSDIKWKGLAEGSPFKRPKAAIILSVNGLPNNKLKVPSSFKFPLLETVGEFDSESVVNYIQSLNWKKEPTFVDLSIDMSVVNLRSHRPGLFNGLPSTLGRIYEDAIAGKKWFKTANLGSLNVTNDADLQLAAELYLIKEIVNILKHHPQVLQNHSPDFFHFKISGLQLISDTHGGHSPQVKDALRLIGTVSEQVTEDFRALYNDNCVVQLIGFLPASEEKRTRRGRSLLEVEYNSNKTLNLAPEFTHMYPVIFNIILWVMIAIALAIFAISWGIWHMDPGRDSLIYRMTSQRKKND